MKINRSIAALTTAFLLLVLLTTPALADTGPKPQLTVRVNNPPDTLYYLDILAEGELDDQSPGRRGLEWSYDEQEIAAMDRDLLQDLLDAVPEGWHACTAEGTGGAPMWGDLYSESGDGIHVFGYVGLPDAYRILIVTKSGQHWISEICTRQVLQSSVTVDWGGGSASGDAGGVSLKVPPVWLGYVLQFLATLLPTLVIEGALLLLFGFSWKRNWKPFLAVNLATQGLLSLYFSVSAVQNGVSWYYFFLLIPAEAVIALVEAGLFRRLLTGQGRGRAAAYGLTANACSALLGYFLAEPVWRFVVSIS